MRYSSVNNWYKIQEVLDGLEGTAEHDVKVELLKHLGEGHITHLTQDASNVQVQFKSGDPVTWGFRSRDAAQNFLSTVREWYGSQSVAVPAP
jgi:hypothetical protein